MKYYYLLLALILPLTVFSQDYELESDEFKGKIITKKGKVLEGYVKLKGDDQSPWLNQNKVEFFTAEALKDGKVKRKEREKFKPKDIQGYVAGDRYFESMKISASKLQMGIGISKWAFVERLVDGETKLYRFYESPDPVSVTTTEEEHAAYEKELERMRTEPLIILQKGNEDMVLFSKINLIEFLSDCPAVKEKYESGEYGIEPFNPDAETKVGKWIARQQNQELFESILPEIIRDYNNCPE